MKAGGHFERQNKLFFFSLGILLTMLVGFLDYLTGFEISFALLYLGPVSLVAWFVGKKAGAAVSVISAAAWHIANTLAGETFSSPFIPYWNAATRLGVFLVVAVLLSRLRSALEHARSLSRTDYLTGVANGRAFHDIASTELNRIRRYGHPLTLILIDLDNFKSVNDHFGHGVGDTVLRVVAQTISGHLRSSDVAARVGGDEFAVLLPETGFDSAQSVLRKIQGFLLAEMEKNAWPISFSIGATTYVEPAKTVDEMMTMADNLLYEAKRHGKNQIEHKMFAPSRL